MKRYKPQIPRLGERINAFIPGEDAVGKEFFLGVQKTCEKKNKQNLNTHTLIYTRTLKSEH